MVQSEEGSGCVPSGEELRREIVSCFNRYDSNSDGKIDRDELQAVMSAIDHDMRLGSDFVDLLLSALDRNGDGFIDVEEFVDWVTHDRFGHFCGTELKNVQSRVAQLVSKHVFLSPEKEARLEQMTLFDLCGPENKRTLEDSGFGALDDPSLLILSVGSSSCQAYDSTGTFAMSFPFGMKVPSPVALKDLSCSLVQHGVQYRKVILLNGIGYALKHTDPRFVELSVLAKHRSNQGDDSVASMLAVLEEALPSATFHVYNRAKDPTTKRYKYTQLVNDFSEALAKGNTSGGGGAGLFEEAGPEDAIVDWGGGSYKVYYNGKRVGTEIMDANSILCEGGVLHRERISKAIQAIEMFVHICAPEATRVFIAQTGKARELALMEELRSP
eukprot:TRINITY_DN17730_c0_g1_i1.p1 TRINITY_DN17730_c0_g1~~TRINITY_DN17730_c0_g1_i1.p1  ORF type:complete len:409 (+),score=70.95 TRINITY_DN17730_c0_g1_i1:73-1227(+)